MSWTILSNVNVGGGGGQRRAEVGRMEGGYSLFQVGVCHPNFQILNMGFGELGLICFPPVRFGV